MDTTTPALPQPRTADPAEDRRAARFAAAFSHVEQHLAHRWADETTDQRVPAPHMLELIRWAADRRVVTADAEDFLHACRVARNAYSHVAFEGYVGPVTLPPEPVVRRLEHIAQALRTPVVAGDVAVAAVTCDGDTRLVDALRRMHEHDYSQLPYRHDDLGWVLVTRDQVGRWVEAHTEQDGTVIADLSVTVSSLADDPRVGPVLPVTVPPAMPVGHVVRHLEHALSTKDSEPGGYPVVLVVSRGGACRLVAGEDLPHLYEVLGR